MNLYFDIETIPDQSEGAIDKIAENIKVKCPHSTKDQIGKDLGLDAKEIKFTSRPDLEGQWLERFGKGQAKEQAEEAYRKTSFDGAVGEIASMAWADENEEIQSISRADSSEIEMIDFFFANTGTASKNQRPKFVGHNIRFDLKFLYRRAVILKLTPHFNLPFNGRHRNDFFDTMEAWAGFNERIAQDDLCKILGIEGKPDGIDGSKVWDFYKEGKINEIEEYNRDDVDKVRQIYKRLNFIGIN
ncbi:ribonuclease H-like domain-containing protein [Agarilytica rhodophyticola]|uniref:ribonuclease H-like domain-containing protein n=1 Tax=Agarilytica rhodophyticola TaxID=1737490 RepID=UPI000B34644C|nr:ribonuclease H-like domain-containing protein [Agarilytica rhodophyticola]